MAVRAARKRHHQQLLSSRCRRPLIRQLLAKVPQTKLQIRKLTHKIRFDEKLLCWQILDVIQSDGKGLAGGYRAYGKKLYYYIVCITSEQKKMILLLSNHRIKDLWIYETISSEWPYNPNRYTYIFSRSENKNNMILRVEQGICNKKDTLRVESFLANL